MIRYIYIIIIALLFCACAKKIYIPVENSKTITTTVVDTVVRIVTPGERIVNVSFDTISVVSTTYATSTAIVSGGILKHSISQGERVDSIMLRNIYTHEIDSIYINVPYEVVRQVTPTWCYIPIIISICTMIYIIYRIRR